MNGVLVIGFGNTLRRDDGAGPKAAERIALRYPGIASRVVHELQPELAEDIARYAIVVFIDASLQASEITVTSVRGESADRPTGSHSHSPGSLIALCASLYGAVPEQALLVEIPAGDAAFGDTLSPTTAAFVDACVELVGRLVHVM